MTPSELVKKLDEFTDNFEDIGVKSFTPYSLAYRYLKDQEHYKPLDAEKLAKRCDAAIANRVNKVIDSYNCLGVSPPIFWISKDKVATHKHQQAELKFDWIESKKLNELIRGFCPDKLLLVSVLYVLCLGYQRVIIVDGSNDGGIDIIAKLSNSRTAVEQRVLFIQSKKCGKTLDKKLVVYEDAFYQDRMKSNSGIRKKYFNKLNVNAASPSYDLSYLFVTNGKLTNTIRDYAIRNNICLRDSFLISQTILSSMNYQDVLDKLDSWYVNKLYQRDSEFKADYTL